MLVCLCARVLPACAGLVCMCARVVNFYNHYGYNLSFIIFAQLKSAYEHISTRAHEHTNLWEEHLKLENNLK